MATESNRKAEAALIAGNQPAIVAALRARDEEIGELRRRLDVEAKAADDASAENGRRQIAALDPAAVVGDGS